MCSFRQEKDVNPDSCSHRAFISCFVVQDFAGMVWVNLSLLGRVASNQYSNISSLIGTVTHRMLMQQTTGYDGL